jgi:putative ABC transport system substrate-binding protein
MKRREFITLLGGAAVVWPVAARAQQAHGLITSARIAFLGAESASTNQHFFDAFRQDARAWLRRRPERYFCGAMGRRP